VHVAGKVVVVIGGGNGIGREVVLELLRRGARVAAADIRPASLERTAELAAAGDRLVTFPLDITDRAAVDALPEQVAAALGEADALINVAGIIQPFVRVVDLDDDVIAKVLDVNLRGTLNTVKAFLPRLLDRPVAHVANVSSMGGFLPVPGQAIYGASKAAVRLLTEALYAELLDTPVGVSVIFPGAVATDITANSGVAVPGGARTEEATSEYRTTPADAAARTIVDGIEAGKLHIMVGRDAQAMSVLNRLAPRRSIHLIQRKMKDLLAPSPQPTAPAAETAD
jgi:NAD(P)-dependent dehydrogenase (short-subunit alcohol dehydrogenase family)